MACNEREFVLVGIRTAQEAAMFVNPLRVVGTKGRFVLERRTEGRPSLWPWRKLGNVRPKPSADVSTGTVQH
jgi:hypothetical protein